MGETDTIADIPTIIEKVTTALASKTWYIRSCAVASLGNLGATATPEVLRLLITALEDENENVRQNSTYALGRLGAAAETAEVLHALMATLGDKHRTVRDWALKSLERIFHAQKHYLLAAEAHALQQAPPD